MHRCEYICIRTGALEFIKQTVFKFVFHFLRYVICLDNILIASVFNGLDCLLIKMHGMSSMNKNFSHHGGSTSKITKKAGGSN